ncbi:Ger(x)C family spore germination protein [Paenibacillus sp. GP183]|uniref:Ger(x)C family spore germination protein n=1 Tax=Paenibacillus sp. GP183 TaxID=1882751 RepID=UPI000899F8D3|nr:Ger(x)C family spore germination protein [Paenibacillus sp. GP183]SEC14556.1 spore germination protein KC/spore germination protein [Paenibacillus sp. GP183]
MRSSRILIRHLFLLALLPILLSGCWDRTETNDLAYVISTAIDLEDDGNVRISFLMALPGQMGGATGGGGGTAGKKSFYVDSEVGTTVRDATNRLQKRTSRKINLAHRRIVVIGEAAARQRGIYPMFDSIPRIAESRMSSFLVVAKGKGYQLLNAQPKFERFSAEAIRELAKPPLTMRLSTKDVGLTLSMGSDPVIAYMELAKSQKGKNPSEEIQWIGYAQFQGDRMVGAYQDESAIALTWLKNKIMDSTITFPMQKKKEISIRVVDGHCWVTPTLNNGQISFDVDIQLNGKVREDFSGQDLNKASALQNVESKFSSYAKQYMQKAIKQMQESQTDSAQFGMRVREKYPLEWRQGLKNNWRELFSKATISIHLNTSITETGLINQNIIKKEEAEMP